MNTSFSCHNLFGYTEDGAPPRCRERETARSSPKFDLDLPKVFFTESCEKRSLYRNPVVSRYGAF